MSISNNNKLIELANLFNKWSGNTLQQIEALPSSGSYREYYRIKDKNINVLGVYNEDVEENTAFLAYTEHFTKLGLHVPQLYIASPDKKYYIIEDMGDTTLHLFLQQHPLTDTNNRKQVVTLYCQVLDELIRFQLEGAKGLDLFVAFPRAAFDTQSIMWDLNYFKYYFLKLFKVPFHEQRLEDDFNQFSKHLMETDCSYFLFRDFQSRNIMLKDDNVYFIDYQGGRLGALQYDLASLLYEAKVNLPEDMKNELLEYYLHRINNHLTLNVKEFKKMYYSYALIRMMQAMGAYGFRGIIERKQLFIDSIPPAVENLAKILGKVPIMNELKELGNVFTRSIHSEIIKNYSN